MRIGTLVNHKSYFGVGIVVGLKEVEGRTQWLIHWLREGKRFCWSWTDVDLRQSVEVICE